MSETTAPANASGSSAAINSCPSVNANPSAPTVVDTTGLAMPSASKIFMRVPLPARNGTT